MTVETPSQLRSHLVNRHVQARPFACSFCTKKFKNKCDVKRHEAMHNQKSMLECNQCDRKFRWQISLRAHQKIHAQNGKQHYVCHLCRALFWRGYNLSVHLRDKHDVSIPLGHSRFMYVPW
ncbi:unnamed protein product [Soboliphyme baturini]|uniref:C2H2-type domain-containing protein n=1 Tax=Soboliphyme baturini TaxID=241478 RepID=A0A183JAW0_9BILA|nr:unnamed protein product [Soboliphyme baturini]